MASSIPDTVGEEEVQEFRMLGARDVRYVILSREQASDSSTLKMFEGVTGVFLSGGDQSRLARVIVGTPVHYWLTRLYENGGIISGTSAGAAIMSKVMITGDELLNKDSSDAFISIRKGNIATAEGLGFIDNAIIDQHFIKRKRHNRLISVVLEHPSLPGIGIDEATSILVSNGNKCEVLGEGTVIVYDASKAGGIRTDKNGNMSALGMTMHVLMSGDRFDITTRRATMGNR